MSESATFCALCAAAAIAVALVTGTSLLFAFRKQGRYRQIFMGKQDEHSNSVRPQEFMALVEISPDTIARYDMECRRIYANPAFYRFALADPGTNSGSPQSEYGGTGYLEKVHEVLGSGMDDEMECTWTTAQGETMISHVWLIPERDHSGQVVGVLSIGRDVTAFKDTERHLRESRALLRELSARRVMQDGHARRQMANELHEGYGQRLSALRMSLALMNMRFGKDSAELGRKIGEALQILDDTIFHMRNMVSSIHPSVLNMGISSALEWLAEDCMSTADIHYRVHIDGGLEITDEITTSIVFKIVQIALSNVLRHAEASKVSVVLEKHGEGYRLEVRDDGKGFDLDHSRSGALGLVAMEELSNMLSGEIVFLSGPGKGTVIEVCFPAPAEVQLSLIETV